MRNERRTTRTVGNSSERKMRTLMMGAHGKQLLHMRHVLPQERSARGVLSKAEVRRRGGDKVKIVEIRTCQSARRTSAAYCASPWTY